MYTTNYPEITELFEDFVTRCNSVLGTKVLGVYVYGSLVWGDFDEKISDVDLLVVLTDSILVEELERLRELHDELVIRHPQWRDRIEVQYFSKAGLQTFRENTTEMANISPGEPLHMISAGKDWLLNWYFVQEYGKVLFGPQPATLFSRITHEEFLQAVSKQAHSSINNIEATKNSRPYQGYVIMTLCRAMYSLRTGRQTSKKQAAEWFAQQFPEWENLLADVFVWRKEVKRQDIDNVATYPTTVQFAEFVKTQL